MEETYEQRALANSKKHRRLAYRLTKKKGAQVQSRLMQLPPEVFEMIVMQLKRPDDGIRLMGTCRLAYNILRNKDPMQVGYRFWGRFYPKLYFVKEPAYGARHLYMTSCQPWVQHHGRGYYTMTYGTQDLCTDPKHYIRTERKPKTELPADPFDSVCKALSKQNLQAYRKESQRDHAARIRNRSLEKVDLERRIKLLKDQWVDAAAEEIKETGRKRKYEEMMEKSLPFIDLEKYEWTSS
jgi:hypothetical protein